MKKTYSDDELKEMLEKIKKRHDVLMKNSFRDEVLSILFIVIILIVPSILILFGTDKRVEETISCNSTKECTYTKKIPFIPSSAYIKKFNLNEISLSFLVEGSRRNHSYYIVTPDNPNEKIETSHEIFSTLKYYSPKRDFYYKNYWVKNIVLLFFAVVMLILGISFFL